MASSALRVIARSCLKALCALTLGATSALAAFVPQVHEARRASTPPLIDGLLDDGAWQGADVVQPFYAYQSGGATAAAETSLRVLWDNNYLYVAMRAADVNIRSSCASTGACGNDAALFNGDVLELFVRESARSTRYHEFEWSPLGESFDARFETRFGSPGVRWQSGMNASVSVQGTVDNASDTDVGWTVEARIPLAAFEAGPVGVGSEWTFTGARYDYLNPGNPRGPELMMSTRGDPDAPRGGVTNGFHTYEIYDRLKFTEAVPEPHAGLLAAVAAVGFSARRRASILA
ncbi:MAG: carbohydrate-binding family 9-like protein [Lacipirellulaceae bacterium]